MAHANEDSNRIKQLRTNLENCVLGKQDEIVLLLTAFFAGGHVLLEDVPGTGKTNLIKALAKSIDGQFRRIQCNPDLLPSDITGVSIYHPKNEAFIFRPGPVMTNILLTDEINRATTKTQSALLEAMEERFVTVDGQSYELPKPFLLMATQNPIDFEGTYTLPEAQLDRFMMKFSLGYPDEAAETKMALTQSISNPLDALEAVMSVDQVNDLQQKVKEIHIDDAVIEYTVNLTRKTRETSTIFLGASPRATLALVQAAKSYALIQDRGFVIPDDIKYLAPFVLGHRILLQSEARMQGLTITSVLDSVMKQVRVPVRLER